MASTPEMVDSVNVLILADRSLIVEDVSEQLGISVGTMHKSIYDDLSFSKVSCCSVPKMMRPVHMVSLQWEKWKQSVSLVGNSCYILLTV